MFYLRSLLQAPFYVVQNKYRDESEEGKCNTLLKILQGMKSIFRGK